MLNKHTKEEHLPKTMLSLSLDGVRDVESMHFEKCTLRLNEVKHILIDIHHVERGSEQYVEMEVEVTLWPQESEKPAFRPFSTVGQWWSGLFVSKEDKQRIDVYQRQL